ncbi:MAG: HEAT repeat domain-containing protein, partial [candidate division WOR-3 bacterium]
MPKQGFFEPEPLNPDEVERRAVVETMVRAGGPEAAQALAAALADPYADFRKTVADSLKAIGPSAVPTLVALLSDPKPDVRSWAASVLGQLGSIAASGPLLVHLTDPDPGVRAAAAEALGSLADKRAVDPLLWMSNHDPEERCRESALWALESISTLLLKPNLAMLASNDLALRLRAREAICAKGRGVVPGVISLLRHENPWVRCASAQILGTIKDERAVEALISAMSDREEVVRNAAGSALGSIRSEKAVHFLIINLSNPDPKVVALVKNALVGQGDIAVPYLIGQLPTERRELRAAAAEVLGRIQDRRATEPLLKVLDDPDAWVRSTAARALGWLGDEHATERLLALLDDSATLVRVAAAEALGELRAGKAVRPLLSLLASKDMTLRVAAARALGKVGDERAEPALLSLLDDSDLTLRIAALDALGDFRDPRLERRFKRLSRPWPFGREPAAVREAARRALSMLQSERVEHPNVNRATEAVAGSLATVHALVRSLSSPVISAYPGGGKNELAATRPSAGVSPAGSGQAQEA